MKNKTIIALLTVIALCACVAPVQARGGHRKGGSKPKHVMLVKFKKGNKHGKGGKLALV